MQRKWPARFFVPVCVIVARLILSSSSRSRGRGNVGSVLCFPHFHALGMRRLGFGLILMVRQSEHGDSYRFHEFSMCVLAVSIFSAALAINGLLLKLFKVDNERKAAPSSI
jgi:hypothetical protein